MIAAGLLISAVGMDLIRIASRVAAGLSQPLSDRPDYGSHEVVSQQEETGVVRKTPGKGYCVKSEKNPDWSGGCYPTKGEADDRLKQVEKFKHMKKASVPAPYGDCPQCGSPGVSRCRCRLADTKCANGHEWHHVGAEVHLGPSDHSDASNHSGCVLVGG